MVDSASLITEASPNILFIFIDGLGIGDNDPAKNPCADPGLRFFNHFLDDNFPKRIEPRGWILGLDATLGIKGLPQSATGQTALLTGVNASALLGRHLNGLPNQRLREVIAGHSLFKHFVDAGRPAAFLNTFRPPFFDYDPHVIIRHLSVTSVANLYAGLPFFNLDDLQQERSVYQDMTNHSLRELGFEVPIFSPQKAGMIIGRQSQAYHFSLYEYFQTDFAGHSRDMKRAKDELFKLDFFLASVLETVDLNSTVIIVTSDHGNIEDLSFKGHSRNPALTLLFGRGADQLIPSLKSIVDVFPAILSLVLK
jgi:2,3-bisphosphoglycerate-independent phosphoglycerate mutase